MADHHREDYAEIAALGAEVHLLFDQLTRRYADLTLVQYQTLHALGQVHPEALEPREIARTLHTGSGYVTKLLDQLEALGLVERRAHGSDARRRFVQLTDAGVEVVQQLTPRVTALQDRVMGQAFTPEERALLRELVSRMRRSLAETVVPVRPTRPGP